MTENPTRTEDGQDFTDNLNPDSLEVRPTCYVEPSLKGAEVGSVVQFERLAISVSIQIHQMKSSY